MTDKIADELRAACSGHPHAKIAWPHRLLHRAADELDAKDKQIAELEAGGWQPIETAPKDGTEILGIQYHGRFSDPGIVRWDDSDQEWWDMDADQYGFPTHWQPLPAPPSRLLNKEDRNG